MRFTFNDEDIKACGSITAAEDSEEKDFTEIVEDKCDKLEEDFSYLLAGIDKLCREGKQNDAVSAISSVSEAINAAISNVGDIFSSET